MREFHKCVYNPCITIIKKIYNIPRDQQLVIKRAIRLEINVLKRLCSVFLTECTLAADYTAVLIITAFKCFMGPQGGEEKGLKREERGVRSQLFPRAGGLRGGRVALI